MTSLPMPTIDGARLRADMEALAELGRRPDEAGVDRRSYSDADMAGRRWFRDRCAEAGLTAWLDPVGNVLARWGRGTGPALALGSHLDTVPRGGVFDGALGCCAALEVVRGLRTAGLTPPFPLLVIGTAEEEGRFGGMLGSQALCGLVDRTWFARARDDDGMLLTDRLRVQGLDPARLNDAALPVGALRGFLELHIEQGPILEAAGDAIGIVTAISGVFTWTVTLTGTANHAGTTPMGLRRDAFAGLVEAAHAIPEVIAVAGGPESRITIGRVDVVPGFVHTVPGQVVFGLIGRDPDGGVLDALAAEMAAAIGRAADRHRLDMVIDPISRLAPIGLDCVLGDCLFRSAVAAGYRVRRMSSGAGHDAQSFATITRAGLVFIPSTAGISHAPDEHSTWEDCIAGANVLLRTVVSMIVDQR